MTARLLPVSRSLVFLIAVVAVVAVAVLAGCSRKEPAPAPAAASAPPPPHLKPLPLPPPAKYVRDHYAQLADCVHDWGHAGRCTPVPADAPERAQGAQFFGPNYSSALRDESQIEARREALAQGYVRSLDEVPSDRSRGRSDTPAL